RNQIPLADYHYFVTAGGADVESASPSAIAQQVQNFLHPDIREPAAVNAQFLGHTKPKKKKKRRPLPKSKITVLVLNGGTVPGEASNTSYLLSTRGYTPRTLPATMQANAPTVQRRTTVYYDPVQPDAKQAAQQLKPLFGPSTRVAQMTTVIADYAKEAGKPLTVVTVGTSFGGKLTVHHRVKLPPNLPPQVSPGLALTKPQLRGVTPRVHFPVLAPGRVAQYSQLAQLEPRRIFKPLKHKHEVVLTFQIQGGGFPEYWQIEESNWTTPPILANPSGKIVHRHRTYYLYTSGGAIQMVALRTPKATYWVVNTILNQLSNSTMISIAESLQPLGR
ncbi:MAG TPA: LytR C-terminal domain-containing protein, partial [Gaiellaceae bacterium]